MPTNPKKPDSPWMTAAQAGEYLGVSPWTIARWRDEEGLPAYRMGGRSVRYHRDELDAFVRSETAGNTCITRTA